MIIPREGEFTIREIRANYRKQFPDESTTDVVVAAYVSRLKTHGEIVAVREAHGKQAAVYVIGRADVPKAEEKVRLLDFVVAILRKKGPMTVEEICTFAEDSNVCRAAERSNRMGALSRILKRNSKYFRLENQQVSLRSQDITQYLPNITNEA